MTDNTSPPITYRPGAPADSRAVFDVCVESILEFGARTGVMPITGGDDPAVMATRWERRRSLFEHLAHNAESFWLAARDGQVIGYARAIWRDGLRELTEFFVLPGQQSAGVGRELLARVFPADGAVHRSIVSTLDVKALTRYLKSGVYTRFPLQYFSRTPEVVQVATDLQIEPISPTPGTLETLAALDLALLGHRRDADHLWLLRERQGYLYSREGGPAGYGYVGQSSGPFGLLGERDFPAVLAHAETQAAARGESFGVEVPLINRAALRYLLARGYRMDSFVALFMSDLPFGQFERYLFTSPPFFL